MRVLIVSDTHGRHSNLELVLRRVGEIDMMVHCGDVEDGLWIQVMEFQPIIKHEPPHKGVHQEA